MCFPNLLRGMFFAITFYDAVKMQEGLSFLTGDDDMLTFDRRTVNIEDGKKTFH